MADIVKEPWNDPAKNVVAVSPSRMNGNSATLVMAVSPIDSEPLTGGSASLNNNLSVSGDNVKPIVFVDPITGDPYTL